jgi:DNA-binding NarL/FixJ family response regulator
MRAMLSFKLIEVSLPRRVIHTPIRRKDGSMAVRKVVIAEDHKILREGLKALLASDPSIEIVAEAGDGIEAIRCVEKYRPDLLLLDLSMPRMGGISVIKDLHHRLPETKILILTIHESEEYVIEGLKAGASGYCLKDAGRAELEGAIAKVLDGKTYLSPDVAAKVLAVHMDGRQALKGHSTWDMVTHREREVLKLVGEGYMNKQIADLLCISVKTVEKHRSNIMEKLGVHTASALTALAIEKGLVTKPVRS